MGVGGVPYPGGLDLESIALPACILEFRGSMVITAIAALEMKLLAKFLSRSSSCKICGKRLFASIINGRKRISL